jgi:hypothetical protein
MLLIFEKSTTCVRHETLFGGPAAKECFMDAIFLQKYKQLPAFIR